RPGPGRGRFEVLGKSQKGCDTGTHGAHPPSTLWPSALDCGGLMGSGCTNA
ncbi:hypothetical protein KI387_031909, partial [Taxus chinensis]